MSATPTSTALTLRVKVWYGTGRVYTAVLYVERSGQLRLCLTPHPPSRPWGSQIWSIQPLMAKSRLARVITFEMDDENVNESLTS